MQSLAQRFASERSGLDFTMEALRTVSQQVRTAEPDELPGFAAFAGEVIIRLRSETYWGRAPRGGKTGVAVGIWLADPLEWLLQMRSDSRYPDTHLADSAQEMLLLADDPVSAPDDAILLPGGTPWESVRDWFARRRERASGRPEVPLGGPGGGKDSGVDEDRFLGSVVTSFVSRGWPFDSLTISQESLRLKSFTQATEVKRSDASTVEFHKQRLPLMIGTYVVVRLATGTVHERMFKPYRAKAVRRALETHGWPTEDRKVTARQTSTAPRPE